MKRFKTLRNKKAMTLIEIMIVITILGFLATLVTVKTVSFMKSSRIDTVKIQVSKIAGNLDIYNLKCGRYPSTEDGIDALMNPPSSGKCKNYPEGGFVDDVPNDAWGNPYQYSYPGTNNAKGFDLWSMGPDSMDGTEDDIGNWKSEEMEE
ncbi:MAG: type II secretion system major pseudopilin GspG [Pseudomonadota bacterium]